MVSARQPLEVLSTSWPKVGGKPAVPKIGSAHDRMTELARGLLAASGHAILRRVACHCRHGVLVLRGRVPTYYLKQIAQTVVSRLDGVKEIVNQIEVGEEDAMATAFTDHGFCEMMRREHRALNQLVGRIRAAFRLGHDLLPGQHVSPRLIDALVELRDHLGMLFALEEAHDSSPEVLALAARLSRRFDALQSEHRELFQELCRMIDYSEQAFCHRHLDDLLDRIERRFNGFYEHFLAHEAHENEVILDALDDDIGTGD